MTAQSQMETLRLLNEYQHAYQRTDLVARLGLASVFDYRAALNLPEVISAQLDRYEQARVLEDVAFQAYEQARGAA